MNCGERIQQRPKSHIKLSYITHFYLERGLEPVTSLLERYREELTPQELDQIQFVIVDDGSPLPEYTPPDLGLNVTWLKIIDNIPWNQGGARNLGALYAKSDNILLIDLDWRMGREGFRWMLKKRCCGRNIYKFPECGRKRGHSNLWFMSRGHFFRYFGYDEQFSGGHGGEDYFFFKLHQYSGSRIFYLPPKYCTYNRFKTGELVKESYHSLPRDHSRNDLIGQRVREGIEKYGFEGGHSRIFLNFRWKVVADYHRPIEYYRPRERRWWRWSWYLRWLFGGCG